MSMLWSGAELAAAMQARVAGVLPAGVGGISIDTRSLQPGDAVLSPCIDAGLEALRQSIPAARGLPLLQALASGAAHVALSLDYLEGLALGVHVNANADADGGAGAGACAGSGSGGAAGAGAGEVAGAGVGQGEGVGMEGSVR